MINKSPVFLGIAIIVSLSIIFLVSAMPSGFYVSPANDTRTNNQSVVFQINATETEEAGLANATLYIWNSTDKGYMIDYEVYSINTTIINGTFNETYWEYTFPFAEESFEWSVLLCNYSGSCNWTVPPNITEVTNRTLIIDIIPPILILKSPADGSVTGDIRPPIQYNLSDEYGSKPKNQTFHIWNSSGTQIYNSSITFGGTSEHWQSISYYNPAPGFPYDDNFTWNVYGCDMAENCNWSLMGNWSFIIDRVLPTISIIYPETDLYNCTNISEINYTYSDINPNQCRYSIDSGTTYSEWVTAGSNFTDVQSVEGVNNWALYCRDDTLNQTTASVTFTRDFEYPYFTNSTPSNDEWYNNMSYSQQINAIDDGLGIDCFSLNDTSVFSINCSGFLENSSTLTANLFYLNITVNDTTCKNTSSVIYLNISSSAIPVPEDEPATIGTSGGGGSAINVYRECYSNSDCSSGDYCYNYNCVKLFDVQIIKVDSPIKQEQFFDFTYLVKSIQEINGDVVISFWLEKNNKKITSGYDTVYFSGNEEKIKTAQLFLPGNTEKEVYDFYVKASYENYEASAYRTIQAGTFLEEREQGFISDKSQSRFFNKLKLFFLNLLNFIKNNKRHLIIGAGILVFIIFSILMLILIRKLNEKSGEGNTLKKLIGVEIYSETGNKIGKIKDIFLEKNKIYGWLIKPSMKLTEKINKEGVLINHNHVKSIGKIMIIEKKVAEHLKDFREK